MRTVKVMFHFARSRTTLLVAFALAILLNLGLIYLLVVCLFDNYYDPEGDYAGSLIAIPICLVLSLIRLQYCFSVLRKNAIKDKSAKGQRGHRKQIHY